jgi:hypothetical protein
MPAYPASLPQYPIDGGFKDERQQAFIKSQMDSGAPKKRKVFTAAIRNWQWTTILNGTQRATFDTFYITTINEGTDSFTIPDPVDGETVTVRFTKPPSWSVAKGIGDASTSNRYWRTTFNLEILP